MKSKKNILKTTKKSDPKITPEKAFIQKLKSTLQCSSMDELANYLALNRDTLFKAQHGKAGRHTIRFLEIIEILIDGMTEKQFQKSLRKIQYLAANII